METIAEATPQAVAAYELTEELTIRLVDLSRKVAGDRYLFVLEAQMDIPLAGLGLEEQPLALLERVFGPALPYSHRYERNFVDQNELPVLQDKFKAEFEAGLLPYLRREDIKHKIVRAKLKELKDKFWKFNLSPAEVVCLV